jgi:uncharacterized protein (TIGR02145 family)
MTLLITLTVADIDTGPFNLYSNVNGYILPFAELIEKSVLLAGYTSTVVPDGTTSIEVRSVNELCSNFILLTVDATTSTTTSTTSTSTSTTTTTTTSLPSILICEQEWTLYNLDVTTYRDGTAITDATGYTNAQWAGLTEGAWCWYANLSANGLVYGKLYNWHAVNDPRGLAPIGYHIPTDAEWTILTDTCLGGLEVAGGKMKEPGTTHWTSPNNVLTPYSGFTGLPGGYRYGNTSDFPNLNGTFDSINDSGVFWSSTEHFTGNAVYRGLSYFSNSASTFYYPKTYGFSVRLIKD